MLKKNILILMVSFLFNNFSMANCWVDDVDVFSSNKSYGNIEMSLKRIGGDGNFKELKILVNKGGGLISKKINCTNSIYGVEIEFDENSEKYKIINKFKDMSYGVVEEYDKSGVFLKSYDLEGEYKYNLNDIIMLMREVFEIDIQDNKVLVAISRGQSSGDYQEPVYEMILKEPVVGGFSYTGITVGSDSGEIFYIYNRVKGLE